MSAARPRLLLDTNVMLWFILGDQRLGPDHRQLIERDAEAVIVSAASILEVSTKVAIGKLRAPRNLGPALVSVGFELLAVSSVHAEAVRDLPLLHRDPFDRLLVAQARFEGLTLLTSDRQLAAYDVDCQVI